MAVENKWQKREAEQYVKDNGGTYEEAVAILFPDEQAPAPEPAAEEAPADGAKTKLTK
jgi:hypothetical protein